MKVKFVNESRKRKAVSGFLGNRKSIKTFCIITPENPMGVPLSKMDNLARTEEFKKDLILMIAHYRQTGNILQSFYKVKGRYGEPENSFVIYNISLDDAEYLGHKYDQESFIFATVLEPKHVIFDYWQKDAPEGEDPEECRYNLKDSSEEYVDATGDEDFFTSFGKNFAFRIPFSIFESDERLISEMLAETDIRSEKLFEQCWNQVCSNKCTRAERIRARRMLYIPTNKAY